MLFLPTTHTSTCILAYSHKFTSYHPTISQHNSSFVHINMPHRLSTPMHFKASAYKMDHINYAQYQWKPYSHSQHNSLSMHSNIHYTPVLFKPQPSTYRVQENKQLTQGHGWKSSTRCKDGLKVLWWHFVDWFLRVQFLQALAFIMKTILVSQGN